MQELGPDASDQRAKANADDLGALVTDVDCVICFESVGPAYGAVRLPCDCKVSYCHRCWDRALAASITSCGRPLCPSCRCPMRVDFDATAGTLLFSRSSEDGRHDMSQVDNWRERLYEQARSRQIQLLRSYGGSSADEVFDEQPAVEVVNGPQSSIRPSIALREIEESAEETNTSAPSRAPRCVCGSRLKCVSVLDRVMAFVSEETPIPAPPSLLEQLMLNPPILCDLCDHRVDPSSSIWTCENGRRTVLHAAAYDVCNDCFSFYTHGTTGNRENGDAEQLDPAG